MSSRDPRTLSEHQEQALFISTIQTLYAFRPDFIRTLLFSVPNGFMAGGENKYALVAKFKAEGMNPGVSDLVYLQPRGEYSHLCIEMKAQDYRGKKVRGVVTGGVSAQQFEFIQAVNDNGGRAFVCYGCQEAIDVFGWYMSLPVGKNDTENREEHLYHAGPSVSS